MATVVEMKHNLMKIMLFKRIYGNTFYTLSTFYTKNAGLFQPKFGSNIDKPKCWVKNVTFTFNCNFFKTFLTQHLGLSIFDPNLG